MAVKRLGATQMQNVTKTFDIVHDSDYGKWPFVSMNEANSSYETPLSVVEEIEGEVWQSKEYEHLEDEKAENVGSVTYNKETEKIVGLDF